MIQTETTQQVQTPKVQSESEEMQNEYIETSPDLKNSVVNREETYPYEENSERKEETIPNEEVAEADVEEEEIGCAEESIEDEY